AARACGCRREVSGQAAPGFVDAPNKSAVRLSGCAVFEESRLNPVAFDRTLHLNWSSAAGGEAAAVLGNFPAAAAEGFAGLIDRQGETDLHVLVSTVRGRLDSVDDVPLAREISSSRATWFLIFFNWRWFNCGRRRSRRSDG